MSELDEEQQSSSQAIRPITEAEEKLLEGQNQRTVSEFRAAKFEKEAQKHWDLFYKRNTTKFFKDRHWTTREFQELVSMSDKEYSLLEVGCGVGNFVFPLLEEIPNVRAFACDFSARAVSFVQHHPAYSEGRISAFQCDISKPIEDSSLPTEGVDIISMVFVLSAVAPAMFAAVFANLCRVLKPGGKILFRDYAVNDMAMIRFKAGTKIADRHYLRQDGTTSYFFSIDEIREVAKEVGLTVKQAEYIHRKTVNKKEEVDVPRVFLQAVFEK